MRSGKRNPQTFQQRPRSKESTSEVQTASSQKSIRMVRGGFRTILADQKTTQSRELRLTRRLSFMSAESHFPPTLFQAPASKRVLAVLALSIIPSLPPSNQQLAVSATSTVPTCTAVAPTRQI